MLPKVSTLREGQAFTFGVQNFQLCSECFGGEREGETRWGVLAQDSCKSKFCFTWFYYPVDLQWFFSTDTFVTYWHYSSLSILSFVLPTTWVDLSMGNRKPSYLLSSNPLDSAVVPIKHCHLIMFSHLVGWDFQLFYVLCFFIVLSFTWKNVTYTVFTKQWALWSKSCFSCLYSSWHNKAIIMINAYLCCYEKMQ